MSNGDDTPVKSSQSGDESQGCSSDQSFETESAAWTETESFDDETEVEEGFDVQTHNGGGLESVEGFNEVRAMVEGIGSAAECALPHDASSLPTAAEVEYGQEAAQALTETVQGVDDRKQITKTSRVPWRMISQLIMTFPNGTRARGTGWFISPGTVMTAGHCVFSQRNGGWATNVEVIPGMNGRQRPFGNAQSSRLRSVKGWVNDRKATHDYGAIILPKSQQLGSRTGWFGFSRMSDSALRNLLANNSGYPGDKSFGTQWYNAGRITQVDKRQLHYMLDTAGGQSGSPTWRYSSSTGKRLAIGIHAYGGTSNKSTRITKSVYANMKSWKKEGS